MSTASFTTLIANVGRIDPTKTFALQPQDRKSDPRLAEADPACVKNPKI